ncbi:MAG: hypothetical protein AAB131_06735 [Actinomycetota bacterium]|jgi:hypothetical protein|nr:MAG: hypothetical protein FD127_3778 [Acidimicrobiaceae bacterium]
MRKSIRGSVGKVVASVVLLAIAAATVWIVGSRTTTTAESSSSAVPPSPAIEDRYGVRFVGAYLTAAGGMVELEYQVLDGDKALAVHTDAAAPIVEQSGIVFDTPGLAGHGHAKKPPEAGRREYVLLANTKGLLSVGERITIRVADLTLDGVILE